MSHLRNIRDLDPDSLPAKVQQQVDRFVAHGYARRHLVVNGDGKVFYDKELVESDLFDEIIVRPHMYRLDRALK